MVAVEMRWRLPPLIAAHFGVAIDENVLPWHEYVFENDEPLRTELRAFVRTIVDGGQVPTDGEAGLRVVRALNMAVGEVPTITDWRVRTPA